MAFNKTFNPRRSARLKKLIQEGGLCHLRSRTAQVGLRETVKAIAEEMDIKAIHESS